MADNWKKYTTCKPDIDMLRINSTFIISAFNTGTIRSTYKYFLSTKLLFTYSPKKKKKSYFLPFQICPSE